MSLTLGSLGFVSGVQSLGRPCFGVHFTRLEQPCLGLNASQVLRYMSSATLLIRYADLEKGKEFHFYGNQEEIEQQHWTFGKQNFPALTASLRPGLPPMLLRYFFCERTTL